MPIRNVSEHTLQINAWIGLCQLSGEFPDSLRRLGYRVDTIDPQFIHDGNEVNPDLILTSPRANHSLVIDCKSWWLEEHQNERYRGVQTNPEVLITRGIVGSAAPEDHFDVDSVYSSYHDLSENEYLPDEGIAVVHFDEEGVVLEIAPLAEYGFEEASLQDAFPVGLDDGQRIPTDYFPFDTEDDDRPQFIISILQSTVHVALEKFEPNSEDDEIHLTADELLEDAHPLWVEIDDDKKQTFRSHTEDIISAYSRHGLKEHIRKVESSGRKEWRVVSKSLQALQRKVDEFVEAMETEMAQTELDDFTDK